MIAAQCDMARPLSEKKNIDLLAELEPGLPPMCQDQSRVQQILNNLLSNAIKFTPEGGRVRVTAQRNGREELLLRVIDTGVGIAEEDQQVIFEKFRQGRTALPGGDAMTREYSGTGLGLSIVKELCKLLEGEVTVESELGTGSTFTVRLPWKLPETTASGIVLVGRIRAPGQTASRSRRNRSLVAPIRASCLVPNQEIEHPCPRRQTRPQPFSRRIPVPPPQRKSCSLPTARAAAIPVRAAGPSSFATRLRAKS